MSAKQLPSVDRRKFLETTAMTAVIAAASGGKSLAALPAESKAGPDAMKWVKSVCRYCGTGCGVMLGVDGGKLVALRGDKEHPTTKGLVCAKSLFLPKVVHSPNRLTTPLIRKEGKFVEASWDEAMNLVCDKFSEAIQTHGPKSVAYYGSGQCMTEESYLANRLFKGGIGSNNVEGNPRLCMASAVGGYISTFGKDESMGCYDDIDHADVFFLIGSNTAECHPVIFDRILARQKSKSGVKVIAIDPRMSPVGRHADIYMQPKPGLDLAVFHAMANVIVNEGLVDKKFIDKNVQFKIVKDGKPAGVDFAGYKKVLDQYTPAREVEEVAGRVAKSQPLPDCLLQARPRPSGPWV